MIMTGSNIVIEAFTELAPSYEETVDRELRQFWGLSYGQFIDRFVGMMPVNKGDVVLDVATGTALIPLRIAGKVEAKGQVIGLDITLAMLRYAQKNIEAAGSSACINLVCASAMDMPFVEGTFDVVICGLGTHHMDVPKMLAEMRRVLRRGGKLIMADVGASAFWRSFWGIIWLRILLVRYGLTYRSARWRAELKAFPNIRTADEWRALLSGSDFTKIAITELKARHSWHPCALIMQATAGAVQ
jgi:ubiquinone/menaquinone biosynthesis C-methylase UbiE